MLLYRLALKLVYPILKRSRYDALMRGDSAERAITALALLRMCGKRN